MKEKQAREVINLDKRFEMFLRKNHLIREYIKAFKVSGNSPIPAENPAYYIDRTLYWSETPQGHAFWSNQHESCKAFFKSLDNEI